MSTDIVDVWDVLYGIMCAHGHCPNHDYCHGTEDEANDLQMIECMIMGQIVRTEGQRIEKEDIFDPIGADDMEEN